MLKKVLFRPSVQVLLFFLFSLGSLLVIFTPELPLFKWSANYGFQIMLAYLAAGFVFLLSNLSRWMFVSFACCASLCVFLNQQSSSPFTTTLEREDNIKIAHFNLQPPTSDLDASLSIIKQIDADIISVHSLNTTHECLIDGDFTIQYPFFEILPPAQKGGFCMGVFSKWPIDYIDTFQSEKIPHIIGCIAWKEKDFCFINLRNMTGYNKSPRTIHRHFEEVSRKINTIQTPIIAMGEFNAVPWSTELTILQNNGKLKVSDRGLRPSVPNGTLHFFSPPLQHILYSKEFTCTDFKTINGPHSSQFGILGSYQLNLPNYELSQVIR